MKNFNDILDEMEADNKFGQKNLEMEIQRCMDLTIKYMRYHRQYKESLVAMWAAYNQAELAKQEYYSGRGTGEEYKDRSFNVTVKNNIEMKRWIEGDPELVAMNRVIQLTEDSLDKIQTMLDSLKYRPNHIQTILEIRKWDAGV